MMDFADAIEHGDRKTLENQKIFAHELPDMLEKLGKNISILSLDCFDTLLWRKTSTPIDVFYDLQDKPSFKSLGFTARLRVESEDLARQQMAFSTGTSEVQLQHIYQAAFPDLNEQQVSALIHDEINQEADTLYCYPPVVNLIREAHRRGLKIIIVSDTYFSTQQLSDFLKNALPHDVTSMITRIFTSSDCGQSKTNGLFKHVLNEMRAKPQSIFHLGDNLKADYIAPGALAIHSSHFNHYDDAMTERLRLQALAAGMMEPRIRESRSLTSPFKALFSQAKLNLTLPESAIGYTSLGPIMYAFSRFIIDEKEKLQKSGKHCKLLFLMRDGYLPLLACNEMANKEIGISVNISRFAAYAASFRTTSDIQKYLVTTIKSLRFLDICKQLLLPEQVAIELNELANKHDHPAEAFNQLIHQASIQAMIFSASSLYRQRLFQHLKNKAGIERGDTLIFIDLGYTGTAQIKLEPVLREELGIDVIGRYLIALSVPGWADSRSGLLDPSWCDERTLHTLVTYIALLEQLCTSNEKSVVDYDEAGQPVFSSSSISKAQHSKLTLIQAEALRFIREADKFFQNANTNIAPAMLRDAALTEISRLLFIPTQIELDYLKSFEFDLNLGTKDLLAVYDEDKGLEGLRKRGLFFMEKNLKSMRTNYPAELRFAGLELTLTLMAQHRFNFDLGMTDFSLRRKPVTVIAMHKNSSSKINIDAIPTHDGYFSAIIPIGQGDYQLGIQFGCGNKWVQIDSVEIILASELYGNKESSHTIDASPNLALDDMQLHDNGLYHCLSEQAMLVFMSAAKISDKNYVLRVVFRPIA